MSKKYVLCPGDVKSRVDGQYHFISAEKLAALYGVRLADCEIEPDPFRQPRQWDQFLRSRDKDYLEGLPRLTPRYNGDYTLPQCKEPK